MSLFVDERGPKIRWGHRPTRRHNIHQRSFPVSRIGIGRPDNGHLSGNVFPPVRIAPQIPQHNNRKINECFFFLFVLVSVSVLTCVRFCKVHQGRNRSSYRNTMPCWVYIAITCSFTERQKAFLLIRKVILIMKLLLFRISKDVHQSHTFLSRFTAGRMYKTRLKLDIFTLKEGKIA